MVLGVTIPKIPGLMSVHNTNVNKDFKKVQTLERLIQGKSILTPNIEQSKTNQPSSQPRTWVKDVAPAPFAKSSFETPPLRTSGLGDDDTTLITAKIPVQDLTQLPSWLVNDGQVLRFYTYFVEKVEEKLKMVDRVRRMTLLYYLVDNSVYISEPKIENSGMVQGTFLNRTILKKPDGTKFSPIDFQLGTQLTIRGQVFHIVDCDKKTRDYLSNKCYIKVPEAISYPESSDGFKKDAVVVDSTLQPPRRNVHAERREANRKLLENDRKVLRFYCTWNDLNEYYPETRQYVLHYYLSNHTIEVREVKQVNSGRDPFPLLLSRRKLLKEDSDEKRYIHVHDLLCGSSIFIYGRKFCLHDCDQFTREYYANALDIVQEKVSSQEKNMSKPAQEDLPHAEDTGIFGKIMAPKNVPKSVEEIKKLDKKVLRFRAKFHEAKLPVDRERQFVITFYLVDDTVAIFEPPARNSGVVTGKFLDRGFYFTQSNTTNKRVPFQRSNFYVGAILGIYETPAQRFKLLEADTNTLKFMEANPAGFPYADFQEMYSKLYKKSFATKLSLRHAFRQEDVDATGFLSAAQFQEVLARNELLHELHLQELELLKYKFSDASLGINYHYLCDEIGKLHHQDLSPTALNEIKWENAMEFYLIQIRQLPINLRKVFERYDTQKTGLLTKEAFVDILKMYPLKTTIPELSYLYQIFFNEGEASLRGIKYDDFCHRLYPCDFHGHATFEQPSKLTNKEAKDLSEPSLQVDSMRQVKSSSPPPLSPISPSSCSHHSMDFSGFQFENKALGEPSTTTTTTGSVASTKPNMDCNVKELLGKKYGKCKYQLRTALRAHDQAKSGLLDEDAFMQAIGSLKIDLTDDETYLLANVLFPHAASKIDYKDFLDSTFNTSAA